MKIGLTALCNFVKTHRMLVSVMPGSHGTIGDTWVTLPENPVSSSNSRSAAVLASSPSSTRPAGDSMTYPGMVRQYFDGLPFLLDGNKLSLPAAAAADHIL